jgi:DNA-binding CsgD family transcriptional regulator
LPGDLLGRLLDQVGRLQRKVLDPRGLTLSTLTAREADMLRLVAEGLDTAEIAVKTSYSERTVKNVLHDVITRFNLRNRAHAVGYVLQQGLI